MDYDYFSDDDNGDDEDDDRGDAGGDDDEVSDHDGFFMKIAITKSWEYYNQTFKEC